MSTATFDDAIYEDGQQYKDDMRLVVRFHKEAVKHEFESIQQGRPIFIDVDYITIITPGSKDTLVTEATPTYRQRFRRQWENYQARESQEVPGTPLSELPWLTKSQVAEFQALEVRTVEQLVNLPDSLAQRFMGAHEVRARAKRFLEAAAGEAPILKMEAALKERDEKIEAQAKQLAEMGQAIADLQAAAKKPVVKA